MANAIKWDAAATSGTDILTTELNSLTNNSRTNAGTEYNNDVNLHQYCWLVLEVTFAVAPSDDKPHCKVWLVRKHDGTAYEDGSSTVIPGDDALVIPIPVQPSTAAQDVMVGPILLPAFDVKAILENQTGQSFPASGSTLAIHVANDEVQ